MNGWDASAVSGRATRTRGTGTRCDVLLEYNREDVMNLVQFERIVVGVGLELEPPRAESREPKIKDRELRDADRVCHGGVPTQPVRNRRACAARRTAAAHEVVSFEAVADVYVINTCTITADADADSRQLTRRAVRRNPSALVVVTGCYAQAAPEAVAAIPGVDLVVGNRGKAGLLAELDRVRKNGTPHVLVSETSARLPAWMGTSTVPALTPIGPAPS